MAVTANFIATSGTLSIIGDALDNSITASRNAAGTILVNGGAVAVLGGTPSVANTALISVFGLGGNDTLLLNEANGALPAANLFGGVGNDTATGGSGGDQLFGQAGNDTLLGKAGNDLLFGGDDDDTLTGGDGNDQVFGQAGNDRMIWTPGDDTDLFEGGAGTDTAEVNAGGTAESFTITANGTRVRFDRTDPAPFALDIGTTESLVVNLNGGDDKISATGNLASLIKITVDGGAGNDTILGSNGNDLLKGGDGNDFIDGQQGVDVALLGAGNDTFQWDPGDGNDAVEGQAGTDTLLFNGSGGAETIGISANGGRVRLTRDLGSINMNLDDVETLRVNALGAADKITVGDLSGTDATVVAIDLAATIGGSTGDDQADSVIVNGTSANNTITVQLSGSTVIVNGLPAQVSIAKAEAKDLLTINGLSGNDVIDATALTAATMALSVDGGAGNDMIVGGAGNDVLQGGDDNDMLIGRKGNDTAFLGAGDDKFGWNSGDGNDVVEGQAGADTLIFNGYGTSDNIEISANGQRVRLFRDVGAATLDLDGMETLNIVAFGGADNVVVGDLSGTAATTINIDLAATSGGSAGDNQADTVTANATNGADVIAVTSAAGGKLTVDGLAADVVIRQAEAANDRLIINALGGDDVINASGVTAGQAKLTINGGRGKDVMVGGDGDDLFNGGDGDDTALMGGGNDTFVWNPGDDNDTLEGQAGTDTMLFNGAIIAEKIDIAAIGGRVRFFRDIANVTMDLNDVETIDFGARGGADLITVGDLTGTDVKTVNVDLSVAGAGGGDGAADTVVINGTNGNDIISLSLDAAGRLVVNGLATQIVVKDFELANDRIQINGLGGNDVIDASGLGTNGPQLTFDGGDGNDILLGGARNDTLLGGAGDDVLLGGAGTDVLDGGTGDNTVIPDGSGGGDGAVSLFGTGNADNMTVSRNAAGAILFNGAAIPGNPTVANTGAIKVFGKDNNDIITFNQANGALPRADLFGGDGDDTVTGGAGSDLLFGEAGNDALLGQGGFDLLFGGDGNDTLTGGDADDQMFGGAGDDRAIWNPGDDTDLFEGGAGNDTQEVNGGSGGEVFTATANGTRVRFDRLDPAPFSIDLGTTENLVVNMNGGNDTFSATGNLAALIKITVDGGAGNDILLGSNGIDLLMGGEGNDFIDGQQGNDVALLGSGNDIFQWDPGDGSDIVEGQDGTDTMLFNGSAGNELFTVSANGGRVLFTRNLGNIVMDLDDVETIDLNALAGTDTVTVNDMSGTDVTLVNVDLASQIGGSAGDGLADTVVINGTNGDDIIVLEVVNGKLVVNGLATQIVVEGFETANDTIQINGLGGNDVIDASNIGTNGPKLIFEGGANDDVLIGGGGNDTLLGGDGDDVLVGGPGTDTLDGGPGDNTVIQSVVAPPNQDLLLI